MDLLSYVNTAPRQPALDQVCRQVVSLFKSMRSAKLNHGDMKATNLIVGAEQKLTLIDLDAASRAQSLRKFSEGYLKDRDRFMQNWASHSELTRHFEQAIPR